MLASLSIHDFAAKMAVQPPPGGGSAAALSGLLGVSLLEMVVNISERQPELAAYTDFFATKKAKLAKLHAELERLIDRDAVVLTDVLPVLTSEQHPEDIEVYTAALQQAIEVPLAIARACLEALEISKPLFDMAVAHVICDLAFGALSSHAGVTGSLLIAAMNLPLLKDESLANAFKGQFMLLNSEADKLIEQIKVDVYSRDIYSVIRG